MEHARSYNSFNSIKESIAEKLERAAGSLGETEEGSALGPYGRQASEWLHHSAERVREFDLQQADVELRNQIQANPGRTILIGFGAGLLIGFLLRRR